MAINIGREIDHIVYAVKDLDQAMIAIAEVTGVTPVVGGCHTHKGTKNALIHLGNKCYLELITVDEANLNIKGPRWMGVDLIDSPRITRWSLKSDDLASDAELLKAYQNDMGVIDKGSREMNNGQLLQWAMILPLSHPAVEIIPFVTDWQQADIHPTDQLQEACALIDITLTHPDPHMINDTMRNLGLTTVVEASPVVSIEIKIECPNGLVTIR